MNKSLLRSLWDLPWSNTLEKIDVSSEIFVTNRD